MTDNETLKDTLLGLLEQQRDQILARAKYAEAIAKTDNTQPVATELTED